MVHGLEQIIELNETEAARELLEMELKGRRERKEGGRRELMLGLIKTMEQFLGRRVEAEDIQRLVDRSRNEREKEGGKKDES